MNFSRLFINNYKGVRNIDRKIAIDVPVWKRYLLTVKEASAYFTLGENIIRELIKEETCNFVVFRGKKALINRKKLEDYIDEQKYL